MVLSPKKRRLSISYGLKRYWKNCTGLTIADRVTPVCSSAGMSCVPSASIARTLLRAGTDNCSSTSVPEALGGDLTAWCTVHQAAGGGAVAYRNITTAVKLPQEYGGWRTTAVKLQQ